jgi:uncharacterized SAM-binding protein YcdF (DUF218 family)
VTAEVIHPHTRFRLLSAKASRFALILAVMVGVCAALWLNRGRALRAAADLWIVSDSIGPADAVAVLGGGVDTRPFAAAAYYHQGLAAKILLPDPKPTPAEQLGAVPSSLDANRKVLLALGVPAAAIEFFGSGVTSTYEEALALQDWAVHNKASNIIVPTEIFSTRRLRWTLHRVFHDPAAIRVPALDPLGYGRADWWKHEAGLIAFHNEIIKYLYYRVKY